MKIKLLLAAICIVFLSMTTDKPAYQLFNVKGKKTTYEKLLKDAAGCEVILFGESHNNPISHWLELQLTKDLFKIHKQNLVLGAEMFEACDQEFFDSFLKGDIDEDSLKSLAKLWPNFDTDYLPLLDFARNTNINMVASNIPRKYSLMVYRNGFGALDTIDDEAKAWMAPLPIEFDPELDCYRKMLEMDTTEHSVSPNLPKAQAIKDATMAYFIFKNLGKDEDKVFLHYAGTGHIEYFEGIMWYLKRADPYMKILTIATVEQSDISKLSPEYVFIGDYIICIPDDMTRTY